VAENKNTKTVWTRIMVRVHIPKVDTRHVGAIHDRVMEAVKEYPDAEVELSMLPLMPKR